MDIIAIGLFAIGVLLVAAGYFLNHQNASSERSALFVAQEMAQKAEQSAKPTNENVNHIPASNVNYDPQAGLGQMPSQQPYSQPTGPSFSPQQNQAPLNQTQQPQTAQPTQTRDSAFQVEVLVQNKNPKLFQKSAYLYLDGSNQNNYTGTEAAFKLQDVMGIRRFGQGVFSYDGFIFRFEHVGGVENFPLENLDHMAFYPNCVVLVLKNDLPAALLFVDETDSIRRILETFKV